MKKLYRSTTNRKVAGVCGGIAEYLGFDPTILRVIFIVLLIPGGLPGLVPYILLWFVTPVEPPINKADVIDV